MSVASLSIQDDLSVKFTVAGDALDIPYTNVLQTDDNIEPQRP